MTAILERSTTGSSIGQDVFLQPDGTVLPINNSVQKKWRSEFAGTVVSPEKWDVIDAGKGGITYSVGSGGLQVNMGTGLDDELVLLSKEVFTIPTRAMAALTLSQRILGQSFYVELVSIDRDSGLPDESSIGGWRLDGTSATAAQYDVTTFGQPRLMTQAAVAIPTTAGTSCCLEVEAFNDELWLHGRTVDSATSRSQSYVRHQQIPDAQKLFKLRLRAKNRQWLTGITAIVAHTDTTIKITRNGHGLTTNDTVQVRSLTGLSIDSFDGVVTVIDANNFTLNGTAGFTGAWSNVGWTTFSRSVAPASNTVLSVAFVTVTDYSELTCEVTAGRGSSSAGQALATNVVNTPTVASGTASNASGANAFPVGLAQSALPPVATAGRVAAMLMTLSGSPVVKPYSAPELDWQFASAAGGIINTTAVLAKNGLTNTRNYVTGVTLMNTGAACEVTILDISTPMFRTALPANMTAPVNIVFPTPLRASLAGAINVATSVAAAVHCSMQGYNTSH